MKPTQIKDRLQSLCCPEYDIRRSLQRIHNDGRYVVATDGKVLAEIDTQVWPELKTIGESISSFPLWKNVIQAVDDHYFTRATTDLFRIPEEKLLYQQPEPATCKECKGEGIVDHDCDCDFCEVDEVDCPECGGAGKSIQPEPTPVAKLKLNEEMPLPYLSSGDSITYIMINARFINKVVDLIEAMGFTDVEFCTGSPGQHRTPTMVIRQKGITCLIMPLNSSADEPSSTSLQTVKTIEPNYESCQV